MLSLKHLEASLKSTTKLITVNIETNAGTCPAFKCSSRERNKEEVFNKNTTKFNLKVSIRVKFFNG